MYPLRVTFDGINGGPYRVRNHLSQYISKKWNDAIFEHLLLRLGLSLAQATVVVFANL